MRSRLELLLQELQEALFESPSDVSAAAAVLARIRDQNLVAYLVLDDPDSDVDPAILILPPESPAHRDRQAAFRIDQADLTILRGLGIDPTRTLRRRRRTRQK